MSLQLYITFKPETGDEVEVKRVALCQCRVNETELRLLAATLDNEAIPGADGKPIGWLSARVISKAEKQ